MLTGWKGKERLADIQFPVIGRVNMVGVQDVIICAKYFHRLTGCPVWWFNYETTK